MLQNGTLALVGSGEYLPPMEPVDRYLLSYVRGERSERGAARVVCLPTAAGTEGEKTLRYWTDLGNEHFTRLGVPVETVPVIDRAGANDESLAARVRAANFVYLSGGKPDYLHKTLADTPVWAAILGVLAAGGVVAGCSAGAMVFGGRIPNFPTIFPFRSAFNFLPGAVIMPHYDEFGDGSFAQMIRLALGNDTLLGIEGNTALVCADGKYVALGAGGVTVWTPKAKTRYTDKQEIKWP